MSPTEFAHIAPCLEGSHALDILRWAAERFAPRLTFATGFGVDGCVIIDLIGRHCLPIDLFTLGSPGRVCCWRCSPTTSAEVMIMARNQVRLDIERREPFAAGGAFGDTEPSCGQAGRATSLTSSAAHG